MNTKPHTAQQLAVGAIVYSIVSALWVVVAVALGAANGLIIGLAILLILGLVASAMQVARTSPAANDSAELGKQFGIIFTLEGIAIGVGSGLLAVLNRPNLILPWVAIIVALHFFPLARLLRLPMDYLVGTAILIAVLATAPLPLTTRQTVLPLITALLLWLAGLTRLTLARRSQMQPAELTGA